MKNKQAGFSLIEIIVVLIIVGILAFVAMPRAPDQNQLKFRFQVHQLQADIQYVRAHALNNQIETQLTFTNNTYSANTYSATAGSKALTLPSAPFGQADRSIITLPAGVTLSSGIQDNILTFNTSGQPEEGAIPALMPAGNNVTITLNSQGQTKMVTVSGQTGLVTVS